MRISGDLMKLGLTEYDSDIINYIPGQDQYCSKLRVLRVNAQYLETTCGVGDTNVVFSIEVTESSKGRSVRGNT